MFYSDKQLDYPHRGLIYFLLTLNLEPGTEWNDGMSSELLSSTVPDILRSAKPKFWVALMGVFASIYLPLSCHIFRVEAYLMSVEFQAAIPSLFL